jgi:hypothetical protein
MLLLATPEGEVFEHPSLEMALDTGLDFVRPGRRDLIAVPAGWDYMAMPGTRPVGFNPETGNFEPVKSFTVDLEDGGKRTFEPWAVAIHPPPGYVRTHHPAAEYTDATHPDEKFKILGGGRLPMADALDAEKQSGGDDTAAMFLGDETSRWAPDLYYKDNLDERIEARLSEDPENQILKQLSSCAGKYLCCCAQNIFYERWEGAVPMAPACTAACLGCLSKDPEWNTPTPQKRLKFSPDPEHIARVMTHHLENAEEPMVSFGQGCEGEPTMYGSELVESVRLTRAKTRRGIIHINTNGSRPQVIRDAARAGANSWRLSINTFDPDVYTAYYRPGDYTFDTVMESLYAGRDAGLYTCINFLIWPGWTDRLAELDAVSKHVEAEAVQMIQLRNLCVDPGHFRTVLPSRKARGLLMGMKAFVDELHRRHPNLRFGTFNPRLAAAWWDEVGVLPNKKPPDADHSRGRPGVRVGP